MDFQQAQELAAVSDFDPKAAVLGEDPKVVSEFLQYCAESRDRKSGLAGDFNARLFDEAVAMTAQRLRELVQGDAK